MTDFDLSKLTVLSGGTGTLIERLGFNAKSTVAWSSGANVSDPDLVLQAHESFIDAGATVILTNTYQANISRLSQDMSREDAIQYLNKGVELALKAASDKSICVVGSIGPFATFLCDGSEYSGNYIGNPKFDLDLIRQNYETQARALMDLGIRMLALETIPTVIEAKYARSLLEKFEVDGWISVPCKDDEHLVNGDKFVDFVRAVADSPRVRAIGINCTSPAYIRGLLTRGHEVANGKPFVVYPNSGEKYDGETKSFSGDVVVGRVLDELEEWTRLGVRLIGGCCRIYPDNLAKIAKKVAEINLLNQ